MCGLGGQINPSSCHLLYFSPNEIALLLVQAVLVVQLLVYLRNALAPVDVGRGGEVLEGNVIPHIPINHLSCFGYTYH